MGSWTSRGGRPNWTVRSKDFQTKHKAAERLERIARQNPYTPRASRTAKVRTYEEHHVRTIRPFQNPKTKKPAPKIEAEIMPKPRPRTEDSLNNTYRTKSIIEHKVRDDGSFEYLVTFEDYKESQTQWLSAGLVGDDAIDDFWADLEVTLWGDEGDVLEYEVEGVWGQVASGLSDEKRVLMDHKIQKKHEARVARNAAAAAAAAQAAASIAPQVTPQVTQIN